MVSNIMMTINSRRSRLTWSHCRCWSWTRWGDSGGTWRRTGGAGIGGGFRISLDRYCFPWPWHWYMFWGDLQRTIAVVAVYRRTSQLVGARTGWAMERWSDGAMEAGLVTNKLYYNTRQSNSDIITQRPGEDSSEVKLRRRNVQLMKSRKHRYKYKHW